MKRCFAYTRVSSASQEDGASLKEQAELVSRYAEKQNLEIVEWFEEIETAAKPGRPVFGRMVKLLRKGKAEGLIMHKIDRSSRNFHDWAQVNDLADSGIVVHFAGENLELNSRGRRLLADIQVVFATDYIRNLKEEVRKGIDGRLREGLITWSAPLGYRNNGKKGQTKTICPVKGPLVRQAFELYASGRHTLHTLSNKLWERGLRNQREGRLSVSGLATILSNPFYIGLIRHSKDKAMHKGVHEPLISKALFGKVRDRLQGKTSQKVKKHSFLYRRMFRCKDCGHFLTPERQKGHVYYRCHTRECSKPSVREEVIEGAVIAALASLDPGEEEQEALKALVREQFENEEKLAEDARKIFQCQLAAIEARENRLIDVYLEGGLDRETFEKRKSALLFEKRGLEEKLEGRSTGENKDRAEKIFELAFTALLSHETATDEEKREQLEILFSNRIVDGKNVVVEPSFPFSLLTCAGDFASGGPNRTTSRSRTNMPRAAHSSTEALRHASKKIFDWVIEHPEEPAWLSRRK